MNDEQPKIQMPALYAEKIRKRDEARRIWKAERERWILRHARNHAELMRAKSDWKASGGTWREWLAIKRDLKEHQRDLEAYQIGRDSIIREGRDPDTPEGKDEAWARGFEIMAMRMAKRLGC